MICFLLIIPTGIAAVFFLIYWVRDGREARERLSLACGLTIISVTLLYCWHMVYIGLLYKHRYFYSDTKSSGVGSQSESLRHSRAASDPEDLDRQQNYYER
mmetsp:Transcript_1031/g.1873  ORF Transcript_1031/g.1873 Transcript_1031/m.1873 type:complete len:101 (-) Transcript_1031:114-416(-)